MTTLTSHDVQSYGRAVRDTMGDLPYGEAHALLDGLDDHLAEVVAAGGADLVGALGSPEAYASELRAAAGLPRTTPTWKAPDASDRSSEPTPPSETTSSAGIWKALASPLREVLARVALSAFALLLCIGLISNSFTINLLEVTFALLVSAVSWFVLRAAIRWANLPGPWAKRVPQATIAVATILALLTVAAIGHSGGSGQYVGPSQNFDPYQTLPERSEAPARATVFPTLPSDITTSPRMPNVVGLTIEDALRVLAPYDVSVVIGTPNIRGSQPVVTSTGPFAGDPVSRSSEVRLYFGNAPVSTTAAPVPTTGGSSPLSPPTSIAATGAPVPSPTTASSPTAPPIPTSIFNLTIAPVESTVAPPSSAVAK